MNWKLISGLWLFGVAMGVLGVYGVTGKNEPWYWVVIMAICAVTIAKIADGKWFLHGFLVSFGHVVIGTIITAAMYATWAANNPEMLADFQKQTPSGGDPRKLFAMMTVPLGVVTGSVQGLAAWAAAKLMKRDRPAASAAGAQ